MTSQLNVGLICKLGGSLMCLAYFIGMLSPGVCTPRHRQTSGRLVQEFNVCTVVNTYNSDHHLLKILAEELYQYGMNNSLKQDISIREPPI